MQRIEMVGAGSSRFIYKKSSLDMLNVRMMPFGLIWGLSREDAQTGINGKGKLRRQLANLG